MSTFLSLQPSNLKRLATVEAWMAKSRFKEKTKLRAEGEVECEEREAKTRKAQGFVSYDAMG